ncbi:MAG: hypothetical protein MJA29_00250 [Candidatus Omnitrophica bacterium]|nr:hypothetical protein [Candidatus Omnitrophota bacterium]
MVAIPCFHVTLSPPSQAGYLRRPGPWWRFCIAVRPADWDHDPGERPGS